MRKTESRTVMFLRLPPPLKAIITQLAKEEDRSDNKMAITLIREALEKRGKL